MSKIHLALTEAQYRVLMAALSDARAWADDLAANVSENEKAEYEKASDDYWALGKEIHALKKGTGA